MAPIAFKNALDDMTSTQADKRLQIYDKLAVLRLSPNP